MLKTAFICGGGVTSGMSLNLSVPWHPHLHNEWGTDTWLRRQSFRGVGSQEVLHTVSGHGKLHPSVICPVNKDYLTVMSSPILDPETTEMTEEQCS